MLALRVRPAGAGPVPEAGSLPGAEQRVVGRLEVTWVAAPPLGFAVPLDDGLAVGEALWDVGEERIRAAAESARRDPRALDLPDGVLGLFVVDGRRGVVSAAASIRCARPYSYGVTEDGHALATSFRALRGLGVELTVDPARLGEVLAYRYVVAPRTLCRDVHRLVGGQVLALDVARRAVQEVAGQAFVPAGEGGALESEAAADALRDAVGGDLERVLGAHAHPSVLLSGGLDSTAIARLAAERADGLRSDSSSFSFLCPADGEEAYAVSAARGLGLDHHVHGGTVAGYLRGLVEGIDRAEEPLHHLQSVMLHSLFGELRQEGVDVALSGEGADGLFGNDAHVKLAKYDSTLRLARATGAQVLYRLLLAGARIRSERLAYFGLEFGPRIEDDRHVLWTLGLYGDPTIACRIAGCAFSTVVETRRELMAPYRDLDLMRQVSVLSLLGEAAATLCVWGTLAEGRDIVLASPFTCPAVVELALGLPWDLKLREPKHVVRALLRRQGVDDEVVTRPKLGFGLPCEFWAPPGALLQPLVDLASDRYGADLLRSLQTDAQEEAMVLWSLVSLDLWQRLVLEDQSPTDLAEEAARRAGRHAHRGS